MCASLVVVQCGYDRLFLLDCVDSDFFFFYKQKTAYELRISDWSSDVCSSDLQPFAAIGQHDAVDRLGIGLVHLPDLGDRKRRRQALGGRVQRKAHAADRIGIGQVFGSQQGGVVGVVGDIQRPFEGSDIGQEIGRAHV